MAGQRMFIALVSVLCISAVRSFPTPQQSSTDRLRDLLLGSQLDRESTSDIEKGGKLLKDMIGSLPSIEDYLVTLNDCVNVIKHLKLIEQSFYYEEGNEEALQVSRVTLCRLALTLNEVLQEEDDSEYVSDKRATAVVPEQAKRSRFFDERIKGIAAEKRFGKLYDGPLQLKRAYDNKDSGPISLKRGFEEKRFGKLYDGPIELKRGSEEKRFGKLYDGPIELKRGSEEKRFGKIYDGPLQLKRSQNSDHSGETEDNSNRKAILQQLEAELNKISSGSAPTKQI